MADQSRQIKLAAAKKKLKEFQQKGSPGSAGGEKAVSGAKKKRKVKSNQLDQSDDRSSPENVNEYSGSNGNGSLSESRPLSSTESLRQLSQQLNGLVSESSAYVNGDVSPSVCEQHTENRNQELAAALESSDATNSQLKAKLEQLTEQSQELSDRLLKERKEFEQKFAKEQSGTREQLQVHIQTIGILVSEKSELQTALQYTQQAARQKSVEAEELNNRLQSTKHRVSELERTLSTVSTQQKILEKHNKELEKERDNLRLEVLRFNNASEESKQQGSEMSEQIKLISRENAAMKLELEDLHKRLELADLMLQQCSSQSDPSSANQQVQIILEEKQHLESLNHQLMESISQLKTERDRYVEQIQEDGHVWKDKTEQLLTQVALVAEERDLNISRVQELEESVHELKESLASIKQEHEAVGAEGSQSSGPSEAEVSLQEALDRVQQQNQALSAQYQAQLRDNEQLSRMCEEQEARLGELQRQVEAQTQEAEDRRRMLEDVQSDKATISRALTQNRALKEQLAELQSGFVKLTNENMELTTAIQSEQHVKKELARRMGELQEELHNVKEQSHLEQLVRDNELLKAEVTELLNGSAQTTPPRVQGDGVESQDPGEGHALSSSLVIPEDFATQKEMEDFIRGAVEAERDEARRRLEEEHRLHMAARHQSLQQLAQTSDGTSDQTSDPHKDHQDSERGVPVEVHQALQAAMDKLQQRFTSLMQEKADLKERVEELEHRCIQLSGETDTIGEYIALYQSQRAIMKQKHQEKEQYISMLAQDKEEMKAKLAELQDLVMRLVAERNEWYSRFTSAAATTRNPDLLPLGPDLFHPGDHSHTETDAAAGEEAMEVVPLSDSASSLDSPSPQTLAARPQTEPSPPAEDGTARQIIQLLKEIQNPQGAPRAPPFLGENPCIPFFYRPDDQDEVKILVI
ncbi:unnamed protein product [Knipowitschia caucasica]